MRWKDWKEGKEMTQKQGTRSTKHDGSAVLLRKILRVLEEIKIHLTKGKL